MGDEPESESAAGETKGGIPPLTRKLLSLGLGALFLSEDYVRRAVKEAKLPREIGKSIAQNASKGKEELFGYVARELSGFLRQMDVQAELSRFASNHKIQVTLEFIPKKPGEVAPASTDEEKSAPADGPKSDDASSFDASTARILDD
jgi:hypothetical protein